MPIPVSGNANTLGPRIGNQAVRRIQYPSPFFDLSSTYLPKNVKELFRFCEYYFLSNPLINAVIAKMSEYPVTDILLDLDNKELKEKWDTLLNDHLNLRSTLIEVGLDYYTFGNCFITISYPFVKILTCKACGAQLNAEKCIDSWVFHNYKFRFKKCPKCGVRSDAQAQDVYVKNVPKLKIIRWDPKRILVMHSPTTGGNYYFYLIPNAHANDIQLGRKHVVINTPQLYIQAIKEKKPLKFHDNMIYHLKKPITSGHSNGYGMPLMLPVLKDSFFLQLLKKSQEAIALEHIVPLRILFPQSASQAGNVMQNVVLRRWRNQVYSELSRWKQDQNYMPIMPYPVGFQSIGGDGKALMLSQEIGVWSEQIVAGMGVPREFIFGGMSYSGSNVSLRMVENMFLSYREQILKLINWVVGALATHLHWAKPKARLRDFKMADDMQRKMYLMQMNQAQKISDQTLLAESDLDSMKEDELMNKELLSRLSTIKKQQLAQADIQGEAQLSQIRYQVKAQEETAKLTQEAQARMENDQKEQQMKAMESQMLGQSPLTLQKMNPQLENPQPVMDLRQVPQLIATKMSQMDPQEAGEWMQGLEQQHPDIASMVKQEQQIGMGESAMKPLPDKLPPRRQAGTI